MSDRNIIVTSDQADIICVGIDGPQGPPGTGGGGGSASGTTGMVQYKGADGAFDASAGLAFDEGTSTLGTVNVLATAVTADAGQFDNVAIGIRLTLNQGGRVVTIEGPTGGTGTTNLVLPATAPAAGQAIVFDAAGVGSWLTVVATNDARLSDARTPTAHGHTWADITGEPTTLAGYGITDGQPLDSDLSAVAALAATGLVTRTGAGTAAARSIAAGTAISVTNGDGVAGNPSIAVSFGTTGTTACVGNDARLSDARTPLAHNQDASTITTGVMAPTRLGSGTPSAGKYLDGTGAWTDLPAGGTINTANAPVNMGTVGGPVSHFKRVAVAATWATTGMTITAAFYGASAEAAMIQGMAVSVGPITNGVGFDLFVYSPLGSVGSYSVHCIGV